MDQNRNCRCTWCWDEVKLYDIRDLEGIPLCPKCFYMVKNKKTRKVDPTTTIEHKIEIDESHKPKRSKK